MIRLFDLSAEFWRNYHGTGSATDAYDLTTERVQWYWDDHRRTVICCDSPSSWRRELDPTYKANRKEKPRGAIDSLQSVQERLRVWGCPVAQADGFEADDLIATFCAQAGPEEVEILGTEKDFYSLISDSVTLIGKRGRIGFAECVEKWGVEPSQMTDFLALVSDHADNIRGCANCGPMRAALLLERFGSIAGIRRASDEAILELKGVGKATLAALRAWDPEPTLRLVRMRTDAPVSLLELLPVELES